MAGLEGVAGGIGAFAQAFMQARQMGLERQRTQAQIEHEQNQDHIAALDYGLREQDQQLARRKSGVDVHLTDKQQFVNPNATPDQLAQHYRNLGAIYAAKGADVQATKYENMAKDQATEALRRTNEAQRFSYEMQNLASRNANYSNQHSDRLAAIQAGLQKQVMAGQISVEDALIRANAAITVGAGHDAQSNTNSERTYSARIQGYQNQIHLQTMRNAAADKRMRFTALHGDIVKDWQEQHRSWNANRQAAATAARMGGGHQLPPGWTYAKKDDKGNPVNDQGQPIDPNGPNVIKDPGGNVVAVGPNEPMSPPSFISAVNKHIQNLKEAPDPVDQAKKDIANIQASSSVPAGMKAAGIRAIQDALGALKDAKTKALKNIPAPQADHSEQGGWDPYGGSNGNADPTQSSPWP